MTNPVLHADFLSLSENAAPDAIENLIRTASGLMALDNVLGGCCIQAEAESDFDIAFFFVLADFTDLEPFGTHPQYARFLQGTVAPVLRGLAGVDVALDGDLPEVLPYAACAALQTPDQTYDWEVRNALTGLAQYTNSVDSVLGLAIGERQRYRGVVLSFSNSPLALGRVADNRFLTSRIAGRCLPL